MELCWNSDWSISFVESAKIFYSPWSQSIQNLAIVNDSNLFSLSFQQVHGSFAVESYKCSLRNHVRHIQICISRIYELLQAKSIRPLYKSDYFNHILPHKLSKV